MSIPILVAMVVVSVLLLVFALAPRGKSEQDTVYRRMSGKKSVDDSDALRAQARESVAAKMMEKVAPLAIRPAMPKNSAEMSKLRIKLAAGGFRKENAPTLFLASKTVVGVAMAAAIAVYQVGKGAEFSHVFGLAIFGAAIGFMAPNIWLAMAMKKRGELIRNGLPDSLDLLVITVESGLALDGAIQRVGDEMKNVHPALSEEFQIATREAQMGIPRGEALDNLAERTQVPEMKSLIAIVNQAEKFGTSIAKALRHQADALRTKRRQAAEERAQKTAVKLMAPLILFIFPAIFVVLVGPAALRIMDLAKTNNALF
jgi:tight adherence protein C